MGDLLGGGINETWTREADGSSLYLDEIWVGPSYHIRHGRRVRQPQTHPFYGLNLCPGCPPGHLVMVVANRSVAPEKDITTDMDQDSLVHVISCAICCRVVISCNVAVFMCRSFLLFLMIFKHKNQHFMYHLVAMHETLLLCL